MPLSFVFPSLVCRVRAPLSALLSSPLFSSARLSWAAPLCQPQRQTHTHRTHTCTPYRHGTHDSTHMHARSFRHSLCPFGLWRASFVCVRRRRGEQRQGGRKRQQGRRERQEARGGRGQSGGVVACSMFPVRPSASQKGTQIQTRKKNRRGSSAAAALPSAALLASALCPLFWLPSDLEQSTVTSGTIQQASKL
jgi:hypothetical protein